MRASQAKRAVKIREAFAAGATVEQLKARYHLANTGVVRNILTGARLRKAGGPLVKSIAR